ncbi:hypothetical protein [Deinococcus enclensis]|uniref:HK97 gp10 family phage protein n=1 Tax=Deinococcus enclensis TaxID=1049582 RepID=A0ABT9MJ82_9DEIO|nr:hypothetical protein [Deinococcus enclensis]MDP9766651.1 hypothetical protein [Deinococcus enclensis]
MTSAELRVPAWVRRLGEIPAQVTREALADARTFLREEVRKNASKGGERGLRVRTGRLLKSIRTYLKVTDKGAELSLGMVFYGWVHNRGAVIVPKTAPRLHFFIPGVGWRTAMRVVLPARPFASDALEATQRAFPRYLHAALERATRPA